MIICIITTIICLVQRRLKRVRMFIGCCYSPLPLTFQLLLRQNSKQKVVDRQPTIVWLRWSKHWLCQMQTKQTQAVGQVVDQVVRQVEVSETVQLSYSVWQSLNFVLWDVQLRQFLQSSNLLQLTTHKTCKTKPTSQTNKQTNSIKSTEQFTTFVGKICTTNNAFFNLD